MHYVFYVVKAMSYELGQANDRGTHSALLRVYLENAEEGRLVVPCHCDGFFVARAP
jgi:hypothetical protein